MGVEVGHPRQIKQYEKEGNQKSMGGRGGGGEIGHVFQLGQPRFLMLAAH